MALGDYDYDEYLKDPSRYQGYLASGNYSDILPSSSFNLQEAGDYNKTNELSLKILDGAKKISDENNLDDMTEEEVEDWWLKEQGGSDTVEGSFKGIERTLENNYGYIDKPAIMSLASLLPGIAGIIGTGVNVGMNISNLAAINAARADLGLEPLSLAEAAKTVALGTNGTVGKTVVDGKEVTVTLEDDKVGTDKKGNETVSIQTAVSFKDTVDADNARVAENVGSTKTSLADAIPNMNNPGTPGTAPVSVGPMTSSPAGGARAASGIGTGWDSQPDINTSKPNASETAKSSARSESVTGKNGLDWSKGLDESTKNATDYLGTAMNGITVTSGMRSHNENSKLSDGAKHSTHLTGQGIDVRTNGLTDEQKANMVANARDAGFTRAIAYDDHLHFDTKPTGKDEIVGWTAPGNKVGGWFNEGLTRELSPKETTAVPSSRDVAAAQNKAMEDPIGQGFMNSPELASNKEAVAQEVATDRSIPSGFDETRFGDDIGKASISDTDSRLGLTSMTGTETPSPSMAPENVEIDQSRFGQIAQDPMSNETFDENRVSYSAPSMLSTDIYSDPTGGRIDYTGMSPAEAAAKGLVDRSSQEKGMMSLTLAGELSPKSLDILSNPENYSPNEVETAKAEAAAIISTMENTFASGKYTDVESALTGRYDAVKTQSNLQTSIANFEKHAPTLTGIVDSFYSTDKKGVVPVDYSVTHYYNPDIVSPRWGQDMKDAKDVGDHRFGILDSQYDIPVGQDFMGKAIQGTLDSAPVPTPTSKETALGPSVEDVGKGFLGTPEMSGQMMNEPAVSEGTFSQTPTSEPTATISEMSTIDTGDVGKSVDSGKAFGESFGSGWGQQNLSGVTDENVGYSEYSTGLTGEESFMGVDAGQVGESPGLTGDLSSGPQSMETAETNASEGGTLSVTSLSTGETSTGSLGGYSSDSGGSSPSSSDAVSLGSIGDAISSAVSGWGGDSSSSSSNSNSNSNSDDGEDSGIGW